MLVENDTRNVTRFLAQPPKKINEMDKSRRMWQIFTFVNIKKALLLFAKWIHLNSYATHICKSSQ